jgi:hypothetical protein
MISGINTKYSIRNLPVGCIEILRTARENSGINIATLVDSAVRHWWRMSINESEQIGATRSKIG